MYIRYAHIHYINCSNICVCCMYIYIYIYIRIYTYTYTNIHICYRQTATVHVYNASSVAILRAYLSPSPEHMQHMAYGSALVTCP